MELETLAARADVSASARAVLAHLAEVPAPPAGTFDGSAVRGVLHKAAARDLYEVRAKHEPRIAAKEDYSAVHESVGAAVL